MTPDEPGRAPMLDYPAAWAIQREGIEGHFDQRCSAVQTNDGMLCDCGALVAIWNLKHGIGSEPSS